LYNISLTLIEHFAYVFVATLLLWNIRIFFINFFAVLLFYPCICFAVISVWQKHTYTDACFVAEFWCETDVSKRSEWMAESHKCEYYFMIAFVLFDHFHRLLDTTKDKIVFQSNADHPLTFCCHDFDLGHIILYSVLTNIFWRCIYVAKIQKNKFPIVRA